MSYKVGDKIEFKKPRQVKINKYEKALNDIIDILKSKQGEYADIDKLEVSKMSLDVLSEWFKEEEREACLFTKNRLIPLLEKQVEKSSIDLMNDFFAVYKKMYAFAAQRDFECFIDYMEWDMGKKVYANRRDVLGSYVWALNESAFNPKLEYIVASFAPSMGKSYVANLYSAWGIGMNTSNSILRLSYSEELVLGFSRTIKGYIVDPKFAEVFPDFQLFGGKPFDVERESDWKIKNAQVAKSNHIARTRMGATTGERASFAEVFDDMTKGAQEANDVAIHQKLYDSWTTEWFNRRTNDPVTYVFVGTQWSPEDILNRIIDDREMVSPLKPHPKYKYTWISEDNSTIVIRVPMLDENGKTTCPSVYPQTKAEQIKKTTDPFLFSCVYQQSPIAPTGREFADELLLHYDNLPLNEDGTPAYSSGSYAVLDPARKGKDNVAMPIHRHGEDGYYYMTDCIFRQKPMTDLYDLIVDKIIEHHIVELVIENNTDTSLKALLEIKLKERGYDLCEIREKYNTANKEQRIKDNRGIVRSKIKFKNKTDYLPNSEYGRYMENLNKYSFDFPNKHDDAPDASSMMASEIIVGKGYLAKPIPIDRKALGI